MPYPLRKVNISTLPLSYWFYNIFIIKMFVLFIPDFQLSLSEYLNTVQEVIRVAFDEPVWVKAEIRNLSMKVGHYYLKLAEKEEDTDKVIASCKATIFLVASIFQ